MQRAPLLPVWVIILVGLVVRWSARGYTTADTFEYLLPWYGYARDHGASALGDAFTNYTPFYTYALLLASQFEGVAAPLTLIKMISLPFELGCATLVYCMVRDLGGGPRRAIAAFACAFLAPTVLLNGALWGQAEAIWCFFTLLAVWLFLRGGNGAPAFAAAFAVKFQAAFLGPFVLGILLCQRRGWLWLSLVPIVYLATALPVLLAGRPVMDVLEIYAKQAQFFHHLTMDAASIWVFLPLPYDVGVLIGLVLAVTAGLAIAAQLVRQRSPTQEEILRLACTSLLLMPLLLPKMHERYFYGFELAVIALAFVRLRYLPLAFGAQVSGVLAYLIWSNGALTVYSLPTAAILNMVTAWYLVNNANGDEGPAGQLPRRAWSLFLSTSISLVCVVYLIPAQSWLIVVLGAFTCVGYIDLVRATVGTNSRRSMGQRGACVVGSKLESTSSTD